MEELHLSKEVWDLIYPVGSIKQFTTNINPNDRYGGTWQKLEGVFLLASSSKYPLGTTGGEETHKLTAKESGVPEHTHPIEPYGGVGAWGVGEHTGRICQNGANAFNIYYAAKNNAQNAEEAHNNMPPYKSVNVWERIA